MQLQWHYVISALSHWQTKISHQFSICHRFFVEQKRDRCINEVTLWCKKLALHIIFPSGPIDLASPQKYFLMRPQRWLHFISDSWTLSKITLHFKSSTGTSQFTDPSLIWEKCKVVCCRKLFKLVYIVWPLSWQPRFKEDIKLHQFEANLMIPFQHLEGWVNAHFDLI